MHDCCEICHDSFKASTINNRYTLVECETCHHRFCIKHITYRQSNAFLNSILAFLSPIDFEKGTESYLTKRKAFKRLKNRFVDNYGLNDTPYLLTPSVMAQILKEVDADFESLYATIRNRIPSSLCPYCHLEVISTETLLSYCLLEMKQFYPDQSLDDILMTMIGKLKHDYSKLEVFEQTLKNLD